jgi:hypothetical protein
MANLEHYKYAASPLGNPCLGEPFYLLVKVDFQKPHILNTAWYTLQAADVLRVAELKDHWIIKNSWYRVRTTFTGTMTVDIGVDGGAEIADDLDVTAAGDWIQGIIGKDTNGTTGAHKIIGANGYLTVLINNAPPKDGQLEILVEVVAGDRESTDGV